jgi:hypothetical protein
VLLLVLVLVLVLKELLLLLLELDLLHLVKLLHVLVVLLLLLLLLELELLKLLLLLLQLLLELELVLLLLCIQHLHIGGVALELLVGRGCRAFVPSNDLQLVRARKDLLEARKRLHWRTVAAKPAAHCAREKLKTRRWRRRGRRRRTAVHNAQVAGHDHGAGRACLPHWLSLLRQRAGGHVQPRELLERTFERACACWRQGRQRLQRWH